jgi:UDP-N-acetylglucosamine--N-acetylmuramyl-(pentapeptide) pyrophosphoryl-undecaprenol N-acetylglucosamine transferase
LKPETRNIRVIISGGGTGGHIFPALSIADELKKKCPEADILFVGASGRMEMERVPAAGYKIVGLPVSGFQRHITVKNILVIINLLRSMLRARQLVSQFKPDVVVGVGGYASGPVLRTASRLGIPTLLQEQNSYAGVTNKLLAKRANRICVAYSGMERYFPAEKIVITGNPVRDFKMSADLKSEGLEYFKLDKSLPVILIVGGSLGARTINEAVLNNAGDFIKNNIQVLWQTGKYYYEELGRRLTTESPLIRLHAFISRMDLAYNVADLVISRAGAISISELCLAGKASILIPSPNVAEDHQTKNAMALVEKKAALLLDDKDALDQLGKKSLGLLADKALCEQLSENIVHLAKPDATHDIVNEILKLAKRD